MDKPCGCKEKKQEDTNKGLQIDQTNAGYLLNVFIKVLTKNERKL